MEAEATKCFEILPILSSWVQHELDIELNNLEMMMKNILEQWHNIRGEVESDSMRLIARYFINKEREQHQQTNMYDPERLDPTTKRGDKQMEKIWMHGKLQSKVSDLGEMMIT